MPTTFGTVTWPFAGSGSANQSNSIQGQLTVVVTRVYENGNLWVQGQKALQLNQGEEYVRVSGLIRPEDIKPGNIIESNRIAQAQIRQFPDPVLRSATAPVEMKIIGKPETSPTNPPIRGPENIPMA